MATPVWCCWPTAGRAVVLGIVLRAAFAGCDRRGARGGLQPAGVYLRRCAGGAKNAAHAGIPPCGRRGVGAWRAGGYGLASVSWGYAGCPSGCGAGER